MKSASDLVLALVVTGALVVACREDERAIGPDRSAHDAPTKCATCHLPEFETTHHPPHVDARPTTCGVCHLQTSWHGWRVDHPWYELTGAHARAAADEKLAGKENQVKCFWCHRGDPMTWKDTKKECVSCHEPDKAKSHFPGHEDFADTCQDCHSTEKWKGGKRPPKVEVEAPSDAGAPDAEVTPAPKPTAAPKPKPKPKPTATTTTKPPDVITHPSGR